MWLKRPISPIRLSELIQKVYPGKRVNPHLLQFFGNRKLTEITVLLIEEYKQLRLKTVKAPSINREISVLKHSFSQAIKWGLTEVNPTKGISMLRETPRTRYLSFQEEETLLKEAPSWLGEIILFALHSGMRMGEILNLTWSDIDLTQKTILVRQSKNNTPRSIPMNKVIVSLISSREKGNEGKLFPINKSTLSKAFHLLCQELGIKDFRFHDLRHSFSTRLSQSGCNVFQIMALMGHRSVSMTSRYAHHNVDSLRSVVNQLECHQS